MNAHMSAAGARLGELHALELGHVYDGYIDIQGAWDRRTRSVKRGYTPRGWRMSQKSTGLKPMNEGTIEFEVAEFEASALDETVSASISAFKDRPWVLDDCLEEVSARH